MCSCLGLQTSRVRARKVYTTVYSVHTTANNVVVSLSSKGEGKESVPVTV